MLTGCNEGSSAVVRVDLSLDGDHPREGVGHCLFAVQDSAGRTITQRTWFFVSKWAYYGLFFKNKWAKPASFCLFSFFSQYKDKYSTNLTIIYKNIDCVLGSQTRGSRMEGTDESTELWRHPKDLFLFT